MSHRPTHNSLAMSEAPRFVHDIPIRPRDPARPERAGRACAITGCSDRGEYRAPVSPARLDDYQWLCLNHVRAHNTSWDYFRGMSQDEVDRYIREGATGHRPTWNLGEKTAPRRPSRMEAYRDIFGLFGGGVPHQHPPRGAEGRSLSRLQRDALGALDLEDDANLNDVKARYKELVKRFHPDANGGDRSCEEQLKRVIRAYRTLKASNFA